MTQDRQRRLAELVETGLLPSAQGRERIGQPYRLDDVRGRGIEIFVAQQPGNADHPAFGQLVAVYPEMVVPTRAAHPRTVAGIETQPVLRPGNPGRRSFSLRQRLQD